MTIKYQKRNINFFEKNMIDNKFLKKTIVFFVAGIFVLVFVWFGVIKKYKEIHDLENSLSNKTIELSLQKEKNKSLQVADEDYKRYSTEYLTEEERSILDRNEVMRIADDYLIGKTKVVKLQVVKNDVTATLYDASMAMSSSIIDNLLSGESQNVEYASTKSANSGKGYDAPTVDMFIRLKKENNK